MKFASAWSAQSTALAALDEVASQLRDDLAGEVHLVLLFLTPPHTASAEQVLAAARGRFPGAVVAGCSATSVLASGRELEHAPALSAIAAQLPGVEVTPVRIPSVPEAPEALRALVPAQASPEALLLLPDPYSCDVDALVRRFGRAFPEAALLGGVASGADEPGQAQLLLNDGVFHDGAVGVALSGALQVDALVAQGCRPVGRPMIITRYRDNIIYSFDCGRPDEQLRALYASLEGRDRDLFKTSLFVGIEMENKLGEYRHGDFLIRALIGIDPESGAMAVGAPVTAFQVAQFHLRDPETSKADLEQRLAEHVAAHPGRPAGVLMFTCLGRGSDLYGERDHDSQVIGRLLGAPPLAGFFCNGEIGPVGGKAHVHGYTSVLAIFRPRPPSP